MEVQAKVVVVLFGLILLFGLTFVGTSANIVDQVLRPEPDRVNAVAVVQSLTPGRQWPEWCANAHLGGRWQGQECVVELVDHDTQEIYVCQGVETAPSRFWPQDLPSNILPLCAQRGTNIAYARPGPATPTPRPTRSVEVEATATPTPVSVQLRLSQIICRGDGVVEVRFVVVHAPDPDTISNYGFVTYEVNGATRSANFDKRMEDTLLYVDYILPADQSATGLYDVTSGAVTLITTSGLVTNVLHNPSVAYAACSSATLTSTATPTDTPTNTPTLQTPTPTDTPTNTPTNTPITPTSTPTNTPTNTPVTPTPTPTNTPTNTPTTPTPTPTNTPTNTP
ncbi:MAG: hypothetical protein KIT87_03875 [Anaerolineae bacterium]|nr:hypothetical protein [Anaerolineae bacterium]